MEQIKQSIILNDGELAIVIGEASIIMNVNTAFELVEKSKCFTGCKEEKEEKLELKDVIFAGKDGNAIKIKEDELNTSKTKSKTHSRVPVLAFRFDSERADRLNDLREGVGKYLGYFDSMQEASNWFDISKGDIIAVANTWRPYQNYSEVMNLRFGVKGNGIENVIFSSKYNGKKNSWYADYVMKGNYGKRYHGPEHNRKVVFFREDEIPQFILDKTLKEDGYIPSCVKKHLKKSK